MTIGEKIKARRKELGLTTDDHLKIITNNCEGNQRFPLDALPPCSDSNNSGVPFVTHPNSRITIYQIAI